MVYMHVITYPYTIAVLLQVISLHKRGPECIKSNKSNHLTIQIVSMPVCVIQCGVMIWHYFKIITRTGDVVAIKNIPPKLTLKPHLAKSRSPMTFPFQ